MTNEGFFPSPGYFPCFYNVLGMRTRKRLAVCIYKGKLIIFNLWINV